MACAYDSAVNMVMLINITINKTQYPRHGLKIIYATSNYDFAVNVVIVINMWY